MLLYNIVILLVCTRLLLLVLLISTPWGKGLYIMYIAFEAE